jgi:hypothetical protein
MSSQIRIPITWPYSLSKGITVKVFIVRDFNRPFLGGNLNMRQLLNPIFFSRDVKHPDRKRQRCTRERDLMLWGARKVKGSL